ncbi:MAG: AAA family ATPase [Geminicoccaceae bacterium]
MRDVAETPATAWRFDRFTLDLGRGTLLGPDGDEILLRPKSFALLRLLVENAGRLLDRDRIMAAVWPNVVVTDESITQCVRDIRKALCDEAQQLLRTVPRRGYLFAAAVDRVGPVERALTRPAVPSPSEGPPALELAEAHEQSPRFAGERRQLTVLFCDLMGSTALAERLEPEDYSAVIRAYQDCCANAVVGFRGHVSQYMGDGVLAFFGYPHGLENAAELAVRAGLAIARSVKELKVYPDLTLLARVGIATGPVVSERSGGANGEISTGGPLNLAARLQAAAEPGTVVLAKSMRSLLGEQFALEDLGPLVLKDLAAPVQAWRVAGEGTAEGRFEALRGSTVTPLVGRDEEVRLLLERWNRARDGEGQLVLLSGEPGIGKSRLLSELRGRLELQGARSLRFHCSPTTVNSAFYPIIDNLERALRFDRADTTDTRLDKLEAYMVDRHGRPREDVRFIAAMLSIPCETRYGAVAITPQKMKDETLRALVDLVESVARARPSLLLFEDAHWADPTTLEAMDLLLARLRNVPLLVVITYRPEFASSWSQHGHATVLGLTKLTRSQSEAMMAAIAGGKVLPSVVSERILAKTDGVPLFVEELTRSILESDALRDAGDSLELVGPAETLSIPPTLRDSLMARLDRSTLLREVAQIGAVIGREFSYDLALAVAPHSRTELDQALAELVESSLAYRRGTLSDAVYTFKHALVQDAAYDSLLKRHRQELHGRIATAIKERWPNIESTEPELLAHHYTQADRPLEAIPLWHRAGASGIERMALTEAIAHLNKGLELITALPPSAERDGMELDLRCSLGAAWIAFRGYAVPEVWSSLYPALALAQSLHRPDALLPILWGLFTNVIATGHVAESQRWVTQILDGAEEYQDSSWLIVGHLGAVVLYFFLGQLEHALEHSDKVLILYSEEQHGILTTFLINDAKTFCLLWTAYATLLLGYPDRASKIYYAAEAHARRRGHAFDIGYVLGMGSRVFDHRGESDKALQLLEECDRIAGENSLPFLRQVVVWHFSGVALIRKARLVDGITSLEAGLAVWGDGNVHVPYLNSVLAEGIAQRGDLAGALRLIDEVIAQIEQPGGEEREHLAETLRLKGWMLSLQGDLEGAESCYITSLDWARRQQAKSWELRTSTSYARLMREQGRAKEAYDLLAPVYGWFTEGFGTRDLRDAKALLAELHG